MAVISGNNFEMVLISSDLTQKEITGLIASVKDVSFKFSYDSPYIRLTIVYDASYISKLDIIKLLEKSSSPTFVHAHYGSSGAVIKEDSYAAKSECVLDHYTDQREIIYTIDVVRTSGVVST